MVEGGEDDNPLSLKNEMGSLTQQLYK